MKSLTFSDGFSTSFKLAMSQFWSVLGAILLWIITLWIPYINAGTTIGLIRIQIKLGKGEKISAGEIFDPENRAAMGKIFLLWSFMATGIIIGLLFFIIPGIVLAYAWFFSSMLILDKKLDPIQAMSKSYDLTYGHKWVIFFIITAIQIIYGLVSSLFDPTSPITLFDNIYYEYLMYGELSGLFISLSLVSLAVIIVGGIWLMAAYGYMYSMLSGNKKSKK
tara:strand:- start:1224 stop:1886 length:663 start_codon:yes stop_codon:yes gene_type:complete